ncbi:DUF3347 domain-containing protein [Taibaiella chishuiensis]|uniref:Uncharacterized protein DUF3347 n=1 Tax=Taibaiella chishuiensis TaxID=1434707 RepID=A0A2P8D884_9BACT|nr:DUF3347 domain-containing protein [Taibaiella chishuiensis]PSK93445.1 uncharacterized protein DUF3347 [Taibaiella chishuiensis]
MTHPKEQNTVLRILPLLAAALLLWSCNAGNGVPSGPQTATWADTSAARLLHPLAVKPQAQITRVTGQAYAVYLKIGDALVRDNQEAAAGAADQLLALPALSATDTATATQVQLYNSYVRAIGKAAADIAKGDLKQQRIAFGALSGDMFELVKFFGSDKPVYQVHCPMAFDDLGGSWLSDRAVIRNPYYGSDMLECGDIVAIIRP